LTADGLTPAFTQIDCTLSGGTPGVVQTQDPAGGTTLNTPATVTMEVCESTTTTTGAGGGTTTTPTTAGGGGPPLL
jgi:hypothetical protein